MAGYYKSTFSENDGVLKRAKVYYTFYILHALFAAAICILEDPDPYVFVPPGSGFVGQRYGSGSFYQQAKIVRKPLNPTVL
jgi:hypothetical protein